MHTVFNSLFVVYKTCMYNKQVVPINLTVVKICNEFFPFKFSPKAWVFSYEPLISPHLEEVKFYFPETAPLLCLTKCILQKINFLRRINNN